MEASPLTTRRSAVDPTASRAVIPPSVKCHGMCPSCVRASHTSRTFIKADATENTGFTTQSLNPSSPQQPPRLLLLLFVSYDTIPNGLHSPRSPARLEDFVSPCPFLRVDVSGADEGDSRPAVSLTPDA